MGSSLGPRLYQETFFYNFYFQDDFKTFLTEFDFFGENRSDGIPGNRASSHVSVVARLFLQLRLYTNNILSLATRPRPRPRPHPHPHPSTPFSSGKSCLAIPILFFFALLSGKIIIRPARANCEKNNGNEIPKSCEL